MIGTGGIYDDLLKYSKEKLAAAQHEDIEVRGTLPNGAMVHGILLDMDGDTAIILDKRANSGLWRLTRYARKAILKLTSKRTCERNKRALRPSFLSIDPLEFDDDGTVAKFLGYLVVLGRVRLSLESPAKIQGLGGGAIS